MGKEMEEKMIMFDPILSGKGVIQSQISHLVQIQIELCHVLLFIDG